MGEDALPCFEVSELMLIGHAYLSIGDTHRRMEALRTVEAIAGREGQEDASELARLGLAYARISDRGRRAETLRLLGAMAGGRYPGSGLQ